MITTIIVIALAVGGLVLSRTRVARALAEQRFMPFVYAAAAIYCGARVYGGVSNGARIWPHALLGALFLAGAVESARASGLLKRR
jgi:hypothetical protein